MDGRDFRTLASNIGCGDYIYFQDKGGIIHEVYTAIRTRIDGVSVVILQESGAITNGWPLHIGEPSKELTDAMNKEFEKEIAI